MDHIREVTEMVERVAFQMFWHWGQIPKLPVEIAGRDWAAMDEALKAPWYACARAAIEALREPTESMNCAGGLAFEDAAFGEQKMVFEAAGDAWRAMITQALFVPPARPHPFPNRR